MFVESDVVKPLQKEIEEFHRLRENSRQLQERARWPEVKVSTAEDLAPDLEPAAEVPVR